MRALSFDGKQISFRSDLAEPVPGPGEALVRPSRVLLTQADLGVSAGDRLPHFSGVLGHQFVGVVKSINLPDDASPSLLARKNWTSKRVVASPSLPCSACDMCTRGLSAHCRSRRVMGAYQCDGCLAEAVCLPVSCLHRVPDEVPDDVAVFTVTAATATHASGLLRSESHTFVTVLGDSPLALLCAHVLSSKNATVRLLATHSAALGVCERWGIKHRLIDEPGRRQDQDAVVDCTGTNKGIRIAMQMARPRGVVMLASPNALAPFPAGTSLSPAHSPSDFSAHAPGIEVDLLDLTPAVANELHIIGAREGPMPGGLGTLVSAIKAGQDLGALMTKRFKLSDAHAALRAVASPDNVAVLVDISPS